VEHIIIDGGSTDGTVEVIRKNENKLAYWVSEKDNGQSDAINKGIVKCSGEFFNWLNADDQLTDGALEIVMSLASPETKAVIGRCEHVDEVGKRVSIGSARIWETLEATLGNYSMGQPSLFYRTSVIRKMYKLNTTLHFCMDMDLWFRYLLEYGQKDIHVTDKVLSKFLVHSNSKSVQHKIQMTNEKYGIYHALLGKSTMPQVLIEFFSSYPIREKVQFKPTDHLNFEELYSYFCWRLMQKAYEESNLHLCKDYFEVVRVGSALSETEKLKWQARIQLAKLTSG
jgi:glycosyltransferase involved in cell wall biosynthesis